MDKSGTLMTLDGAMLGEKKSDGRYCVNLSSIAGNKHWFFKWLKFISNILWSFLK